MAKSPSKQQLGFAYIRSLAFKRTSLLTPKFDHFAAQSLDEVVKEIGSKAHTLKEARENGF